MSVSQCAACDAIVPQHENGCLAHHGLRVDYEHSLASAPDDYIAKVPSQVVKDVPANIPRALLPEYVTDLILKRSARIGKLRHLRIL